METTHTNAQFVESILIGHQILKSTWRFTMENAYTNAQFVENRLISHPPLKHTWEFTMVSLVVDISHVSDSKWRQAIKQTSEEKTSRKTHNPGIYLLGTTPLRALSDPFEAAEALRPRGESNMTGCSKNMPNNDSHTKWLKGHRPLVGWCVSLCSHTEHPECVLKRIMTASRQDSAPHQSQKLKRCHLFHNQQVLGSRQIVED